MKASDIAKKKSVTVEDVVGVCGDLGIKCADGEAEIAGNDVFLVEKRIETRNEERARHAAELMRRKAEEHKTKKIKLKRKVEHVKKGGEEKADEAETVEHAAPAAPVQSETPAPAQPAAPRPASTEAPAPRSDYGDRRPQGDRPGYQGDRKSVV